jgi:hypothetical protein
MFRVKLNMGYIKVTKKTLDMPAWQILGQAYIDMSLLRNSTDAAAL